MAHPTVTSCKDDETVVFYCQSKENAIAICLADDKELSQPKLIYRFSPLYSKPELEYPISGKGRFLLSVGGSPRSREERLRFAIGDIDYVVYSLSDADRDNHAGVLVLKNNKKISQARCELREEPWPIRIPESFASKEKFNWHIKTP